eukprot:571151-Hanusia_phi.AAC.2
MSTVRPGESVQAGPGRASGGDCGRPGIIIGSHRLHGATARAPPQVSLSSDRTGLSTVIRRRAAAARPGPVRVRRPGARVNFGSGFGVKFLSSGPGSSFKVQPLMPVSSPGHSEELAEGVLRRKRLRKRPRTGGTLSLCGAARARESDVESRCGREETGRQSRPFRHDLLRLGNLGPCKKSLCHSVASEKLRRDSEPQAAGRPGLTAAVRRTR